MKKNLIFFLITISLFAAKANAGVFNEAPVDYRLVIEDGDLSKDEVNMVPVTLYNAGDVLSIQFDIQIPEGLSFDVDDSRDYYVEYGDRFDNSHVATAGKISGGLRVIIYSNKNRPVSGNEGVLVYIPVRVNEGCTDNMFQLKLVNGFITLKGTLKEIDSPDSEATYSLPVIQVPGDADGDGEVNVKDIQRVLNIITARKVPQGGEPSGDVNDDGQINVKDIQRVLNIITGRI